MPASPTKPIKIGLIGHSHSIALLDALGEWRSQIAAPRKAAKDGFSSSFAGFHQASFNGIVRFPPRELAGLTAEVMAAIVGGGIEKNLTKVEFDKDKTRLSVAPLLHAHATALSDCSHIVSIMFGNDLAPVMYIADQPPYDFFDPDLPACDTSVPLVDQSYIDLKVGAAIDRIIAPLYYLGAQTAGARLLHVLPPPPVKDPNSIPLKESWGSLLAAHGVVPASLRMKWYRRFSRRAKELLAKNNVCVVAPPSSAQDADGFLRTDLVDGLSHGNKDYGTMVWSQVIQAINDVEQS